jgi:trimeric autotransporter adhesin
MRSLNHIFKVKWSTALNAFVVVAEIIAGACKSQASNNPLSQQHPKHTCPLFKYTAMVSAIVIALYPTRLAANPGGFHSIYGNTEISVSGNVTTLKQTSDKAIVNWDSFNIDANERVSILQPQGGVALYRVIGQDASSILGALTATGSLFLVNQNGIYFGPNAQVDVGSIVASTLNIKDADFLKENYRFSGISTSAVENLGVIKTADEGYIVMLANNVSNSGRLIAHQGSVALAASNEAYLDFFGNGLVRTKLAGDAVKAIVNQSGTIQADGGRVQLATSARASAINMQGVIQANSLVEREGRIVLEGGDHAQVAVSGQLRSSADNGGTVAVTGEQVALFNGTSIDVSGAKNGGHIFIGGGLQGKNPDLQNARTTYVDENVVLNASAGKVGSGGQVIVWADGSTKFYGNILAKGGSSSGAGGFAEVSGKQTLKFAGQVDVSATNGDAGTLLLDPSNINLVNGASANTTGFNSVVDQTEAYTDDAGLDSTFNVAAGGSFAGVAAGSNIVLQATNDINVNTLFDVNTATGKTNVNLEMVAGNNININTGAGINASTSGTLTLMADTSSGNVHNGAGDLLVNANIRYGAGAVTLYGANIRSTTNANIQAGFNLAQGATTGALNATTSTNGQFSLGTGAINTTLTGVNANHSGSVTINAGSIVATAINSNGALSNDSSLTLAGGNGGNINLTANYSIISVGSLNSNGANAYGAAPGKAGNISLTSSNGITASLINLQGGNALANASVPANPSAGGNAGVLTINNGTFGNVILGSVTARSGTNGGAASGSPVAGSVSITNTAGNVTATSINTAGNTNTAGGNVSATATGTVNIATLNTSGGTAVNIAGPKNAGTITIAGSEITTTQITATGGAAASGNTNGGVGGAVNLTASATNGILFNTINTSGGNKSGTGTGGTGGAVTFNGSAYADGLSSSITALSGNAGASGTGGAITFNGVLNSSSTNYNDLSLNTNGKTVFTQNVGALKQLNSLTTDALGSTEVNGVNFVTTLKDQTYNDALTVKTVGPTFRTTANGNIFINGSLNSNSAACCVTVNFNVGGSIYLNSAVGNVSQLYSLNTGSTGTTYVASGLAIKTQISQTYGNNVIFAGNATLASNQGGAISFNKTVTSPGILTVTNPGNSFTATNINNDFNTINFTNIGNVSVYDSNALSLSAASVSGFLRATTVNDLSVAGDIRTLNTGFDTTLKSTAGNIILAANLIANKNASINLIGENIIRNAGNITTNGGNVSMVARNQVNYLGSITTTGTLDTTTGNSADSGNVEIYAKDISLASVTTKSNTSSSTFTGVKAGDSGSVTMGATGFVVTGAINTSGANTASDNSTVGKGGALTVSAVNGISLGAITTGGGAANGLAAIAQNGGDVMLSNNGAGAISLTTVNTANATGTSNQYTPVRSGNVSISNAAGDVTLTGATTTSGGKNAAGGNVSIQSSDNINAGSINAAGATVTDGDGMYGGNITLNAGNAITAASLAANGSNASATNGNGGQGGNVVVTAAQFNGTTIRSYGGNATGTGVAGNGGDITVNSDFFINSNTDINANAGTGSLSAAAGLITINGNINAANANNYQLSFNTNGSININGAIGNLDQIYRLSTNTGSTLNFSGEQLYVDGLIALNGNLTLSAPTVDVNTFGVDHFTVNGVVDAKNTVINANVGSRSFSANTLQNDFKEINIVSAGTVTISDRNDLAFSALNADTMTIKTAGDLQTSGSITSNAINGSVRLYAGNDLNITHAVSAHGNSSIILRSDFGYDAVLAPMDGVGNTTISANVTADNGQVNAAGVNLYQPQGLLVTQGDLLVTYANDISLTHFDVTGNAQLTAQNGNIVATGTMRDPATSLLVSAQDIQLAGEFNSAVVLNATAATHVQGAFNNGLTITANGDTLVTDATVHGLLDIHTTGKAAISNSVLENVTAQASLDLEYQANASGNVVLMGDQNVTLSGSASTLSATSLQDMVLAGDFTSSAGSDHAMVLDVGGHFYNPDNHALLADNHGHWQIYAEHRQGHVFGDAINASDDFIDYGKSMGDALSASTNGLIFSEHPEVSIIFSGNITKIYDGNNQLPATSYQLTTTGMYPGDTVGAATIDVHYDSPTIGQKVIDVSYVPASFITDTGKPVFGYSYTVVNQLTGEIFALPVNPIHSGVAPIADFYVNPYLHHGFTSTIAANGSNGGYSIQPQFLANLASYDDELSKLKFAWIYYLK